MKFFQMALLTIFMLLLSSCEKNENGNAEKQAPNSADRAAALDQGPRASLTLKLNENLANRGQDLFDDRSCSDCHTLGEAEMAPDLLGILDRRTEAWLKMQITQPEWMAQHDPITKKLIEEFDLDMIETGVVDVEAEALLHYLLRENGDTTP